MRKRYDRYQNELLTLASVLITLIIWVISTSSVRESLLSKWPYVVLGGVYVALASRVVFLGRASRFLQERSLSQVPDRHREFNRYREALDAANTCYMFLGMSAEEFQREVSIHDYFRDRQARGLGVLNVQVLLLHPDSPHFAAKLHDVNPGADLQQLIQRKKDIMRTLVRSFSSVPSSSGSFDVRFCDATPIWMMQFYDRSTSANRSPDTMRLMAQLAGRHSKFSPLYELDNADPVLFRSFLGYFEGLWEQSMPLKPDGAFPDLHTTSGSTLTTLAFDFDGTLVASSALKRDAFMHAMRPKSSDDQERCEHAYVEHGALNRLELLRNSFFDVYGRLPSENEKQVLASAYTEFFRSHLNEVTLVPGFSDFHAKFQHRYRFIIVSNAPRDEILEMCHRLGIDDLFLRIYGFPTSKVAALREVLDDFGIEPAGILYVGDRVEDRIVAESVGTRFSCFDPSSSPGSRPYLGVNSFSDLAGVLYNLDIGVEP